MEDHDDFLPPLALPLAAFFFGAAFLAGAILTTFFGATFLVTFLTAFLGATFLIAIGWNKFMLDFVYYNC